MIAKTLHTRYGNAKLDGEGYYRITSIKEGNCGKRLHRLIARDYFGDWINDPNEFFSIHHIDGDKSNNCVLNLEPLPPGEHSSLHNAGENHPNYGRQLSEETKIKLSSAQNTSGYYRVIKQVCPECKQGFMYAYLYYENGTRKRISSVDLKKLEKKVRVEGLEWFKLSEGGIIYQ